MNREKVCGLIAMDSVNMAKDQRIVCPKCGRMTQSVTGKCVHCGARLASQGAVQKEDPYIGQVIADVFSVESVLGDGSMGIVYKALHTVLGEYVAVKVLRQDYINNPEVLARFWREAEAAGRLEHPNVIKILDYGRTFLGAPFMAMEFLEGEELGKTVIQHFPLKQRRICEISLQIARALEAAHAAGIIHQDLKPANIMLIQQEGQEVAKLLDFGVAKMTGDEDIVDLDANVVGTPAFMSPEQVAKQGGITPATDLFSLGGVMYYMLTNRLPFNGTEVVDISTSILTEDPIPPSQARLDTYIDPSLESVCLKALQKNPDNRYCSAHEMVEVLEKVLPLIPEVNPQIKHKVVVGTPLGEDLSGETRFNVEAFTDIPEASSEVEEGGTMINMTAITGEDKTRIGKIIQNDGEGRSNSHGRVLFFAILIIGVMMMGALVVIWVILPTLHKEPQQNIHEGLVTNTARYRQQEMRPDAMENVVITAGKSAVFAAVMGTRDILADRVEQAEKEKAGVAKEAESESHPVPAHHLRHSEIKAKMSEAEGFEMNNQTAEACNIYQFLLNEPALPNRDRRHILGKQAKICQ